MRTLRVSKTIVFCLSIVLWSRILSAQDNPAGSLTDDKLRKGANLLVYPDYGSEDPMPLVKHYDGLRVTDVLDAMQAVGLQDIGVMDHTIRPLWRDNTEKLAHRVYGVAVTYQYLPTNRPPAGRMPYEEFRKWHSDWYKNNAPELFSRILRPGTVLVIDAQGIDGTGFIGSNNALKWKSLGMTGVVSNGGCRDTDEFRCTAGTRAVERGPDVSNQAPSIDPSWSEVFWSGRETW